MLAGKPSSKETITLRWSMPDVAWDHWAQGRCDRTVRDVILDGLDQIHKRTEAVKKIRMCCEAVALDMKDQGGSEVNSTKNKIEIQLPSAVWGKACQRVGRINDNPVRTRQLLAALILESESWKQSEDADTNWDAGWNEYSLISSLESLTTTTGGLSLGRDEKRLARIVALAAVITAVATVFIAIAAWCNP